ncbi:hypothetical protein EZV62_003181 [Acer yangbiense]|uniref:Uncharacterized protein n=1 Tax=Acer yangbiense TaxID=1000413 RepID=A0A5C7IIB6_9ROSI|nr:hypothetical protein EZV62_003181 [Acer yangbiense]
MLCYFVTCWTLSCNHRCLMLCYLINDQSVPINILVNYLFRVARVLTSSLNTIVCGGQINVQSNESPVYAEKAKDLNRQALIQKWAPVAIVFGVVFVLFWLKSKIW